MQTSLNDFSHSCGASVRGNVVLMSLFIITVLAVAAAIVSGKVFARYVATVQNSSWQEARIAAEGGIDLALASLNSSIPDPSALTWSGTGTGAWNGWTSVNGGSAPLAVTSGTTYMTGTTGVYPVAISKPVFFSQFLTNSTLQTQVDVQVCALYPDPINNPDKQWFWVRSRGATITGTPGLRMPEDKMDVHLRRLTLSGSAVAAFRPAVCGTGSGVASDPRAWLNAVAVTMPNSSTPVSYATRIMETIVKPVPAFSIGGPIQVKTTMKLGTSQNWRVDSYNSADPSNTYRTPGDPAGGYDPNKIDTNPSTQGTVASSATSGTVITAPKSGTLMGNAAVNGAGAVISGVVNGTVSTNFNTIPVAQQRPANTPTATFPAGNGIYPATGTKANPTIYHVNSDPGTLTFTAVGSANQYITLVIDAPTWNDGGVTIPSNVFVTIYIKGNIAIKANSSTNTSNPPSHLLIYGETPAAGQNNVSTLNINGNPVISALFYGPDYDMSVGGTPTWYGAVVANSYDASGGGNGGMHYDEALANSISAPTSRYTVATYIEDSRQ